MNLNLIILFAFYWFIVCSVVGYGLIFSKYFFKEENNYNFGYFGIYGLVILILYSYIINLVFTFGYFHNFILFLFGFVNFIFFIKKNSNKFSNQLNKIHL